MSACDKCGKSSRWVGVGDYPVGWSLYCGECSERLDKLEAEIKEMALKTIAEIGQEIEQAVLLPKKPPFIGGIQEGLPERQWLMTVKDLEEYVAQDRAQRAPLTEDQIAAAVFDLYTGPDREDLAELCFGRDKEIARRVERAHGIGAKP